MKKKKKAPSLSTLRNKLDDLFSRYVRLSAADSNGYCRCVACGKVHHWQEMDAGHFVGRQASLLRFDERNVHPECRKCNRFSPDHLIGYTIWMQEEYGDMVISELWANKHTVKKWTRSEYEELIDEYSKKLASLAMGRVELSEETNWALQNVS